MHIKQIKTLRASNLKKMVSALVEWLKQTIPVLWPRFDSRDNLINAFSIYLIDVMINAPMKCLNLNRLQKSDGQQM